MGNPDDASPPRRARRGVGDSGLDLARYPLYQRAHAPAGGALRVIRQVLLGVRHAVDVEVRPGDVILRALLRNEEAQEGAALERAALAAAGVDDVGGAGLDVVALVLADGQPPHLFARQLARLRQFPDQLV